MPIKTNATQPGYSLFSSNNNKTQSTSQRKRWRIRWLENGRINRYF